MGNLLDMTLRDLERVIYYTNYVVIDPGEQEVQEKELLDEDRFLELRTKAKTEGDAAFKADIGAPAVRALLERLNIDKLADELREAVAGETSQHRKKQQLKRLKIVDAFRNSRSEEHTSELQSQSNLVCRLLLEKKKKRPHSTDLTSYKHKYSRLPAH